jgi:hypothetical protein
MKKLLLLIFTIIASSQVKAQFVKEKSINVSVGLGLSAPTDEFDVIGSGFYLQGEYVVDLKSWIDIRPYAGLILTKAKENKDQQGQANYRSTSNAFLIGGKARIKAPIPWISPYIETGIGASIGSFETITPYTNIDKSGLIPHIPFSLGLELGPKHNFDIAFTYYFHPSAEQFAGAAAFGISFPL